MPLFKHLHYSDSDIATVTKLFGFWVALGGTFIAGLIITRIGIMATLLIGTVVRLGLASGARLSRRARRPRA